MTRLQMHKEQIRNELSNCRTLHELWRIAKGMEFQYPAWLVNQERCRRHVELTMDLVFRNRRVKK